MVDYENPERQTDDPEGRKAGGWLTAAISLAAIGVGVFGMIVWRWGFEPGADTAQRIQILTPFAVFLGAAVTFLTVVWRGLITSRQANFQQRQIDTLAQQVAAADEARTADLLLKGAELLASEKDAETAAGITALQLVAETPKAQFANPARRLLLDYVQREGASHHRSRLVQLAIAANNVAYHKTGEIIDEKLVFIEPEEAASYDDYGTNWRIVRGLAAVLYCRGIFSGSEINAVGLARCEFLSVGFVDCVITDPYLGNFEKCRFSESEIKGKVGPELAEHAFRNCDFSGTRILVRGAIPDLRKGGNYYYSSFPPHAEGTDSDPDWTTVFQCLEEDRPLPY